jgi:GTP pyrophosphokinase
LFYRVEGSIENQQLKDFAAQKSNTLMNFFKSKIKRSGPTADADIHKQVLKQLLCLFLVKNKIN